MNKFNPNTDPLTRNLDMLVYGGVLLFLLISILISIICAFNIRDLIFFGAMVPDIFLIFPLTFLLTLFNIYLICAMILNLTITFAYGITYAFYMAQIFKELKLGCKFYRTLDSLREANNLRLCYRSFQIHNSFSMTVAGSLIFFLHSACMLLPIYTNMVAFTYSKKLSPLVSCFYLGLAFLTIQSWLIFLQLGKHLFTQSERIFSSWKRHQWKSKEEGKLMGKFRKSCGLVTIRYGNQFVVRRITPFLYVKGVIRGTFRGMLTLTENL